MVHDAMPSRGKVQQIQLRPITAAACRSLHIWILRRCQQLTGNALNFQPVESGALRFELAEDFRGLHSLSPKLGAVPGGCILRRSFCRAEVGPPLSPEKWKGVKRIHTLAGRHGSTLLNIRAAAQATFPGKEKGRPSLHPAASHPRQASHTCRGMGFRAVR